MSSTFRGARLLSDTLTHMEVLLGQPPSVAMTQCISSITPHLEPPEEQQEQEDGEKRRLMVLEKGKECVDQ